MVTGAKCLMFFECHDSDKENDFEGQYSLRWVIDKLLCSERLEVTLLKEEDFAYKAKDSISGAYYGTKRGYPILEFTPTGLPESRGRDKHKAGCVVSRVFKLARHKKRTMSGRQTTFSFSETLGLAYVVHLRGKCWGKIPPPDNVEGILQQYYSKPTHFVQEEKLISCVYDYQKAAHIQDVIYKYQAGSFTKWKRFRGVGFIKKYLRSSAAIYDINEYTSETLVNYGHNLLQQIMSKGKVNTQFKFFNFPSIGVCINLKNATMLCHRALSPGDNIDERKLFTKVSECGAVLGIKF